MMMTLIVSTPGSRRGNVIPIARPTFLIGRDQECQLRPASDLVSRRHCALRIRDDRAFVQDVGSANGTFVNGQRVEGAVELRHGDRLRVGPLEFEVGLRADTPAPASDDEAAALLLSLDGGADAVPEGETPPAMPAVSPAPEPEKKQSATKYGDDAAVAATAILRTYLRRPR